MTAHALDRLDQLIASRSILGHPFYQAWTRGELTAEQLRTYARIYFTHVEAFPSYLERAIVGAEDAEIRRGLVANLIDELSRPQPHADLWRRFADAVGVEELEGADPRARETVERFARLCASGTVEALAALYAYESQQPEVAATKIEGLSRHYGVDDSDGLSYFTVHREADVAHRREERAALGRTLDHGGSPERALAAAQEALDAYWSLLDQVELAA